MEEEKKKKVDESYKNQVEKERVEKEAPGAAKTKEEFLPPEASFSFFVTTLAMQITIAFGDMADPQLNKKQENLPQAKFLIDILGVLEEKTKGNLTKEEHGLLESILYELRMRYVQKSGEKK